jgi:O-antigen ligase
MMALAGFTVSLLLQAFPNTMMESIAPFMLEHKVHYIVGAGCFVLILAHMALELHVRKETMEKILKIMSWVFAVFVIVAAVITVIYIRTHYDEWMLNRRGILWKIALYVFGDFELKEKIIGIGPSCINHRSVDYAFWIVEYYGKFYDIDNAHIDVLEYLVTTGITGCIAYVMMFLSVAVNLMQSFIKKREPGRERCLLAAGIVGYAGQALLYGPHPLIWCTCMMMFALYRSADIEEKRQAEILE